MFEAYKIGIKISLINHVSAGLLGMSKDFAKAEGAAALYEKRLKSIQSQALKGAMMFGAGVAGFAALKGPYEEAKKLSQAQANFQTLNLSALENSQAFSKAANMSHTILGTTITDNVKGIHDLHTAFGDLHHAIKSADDFAKFSFVAKVMNEGKPVEGLVYNAAKALEHRGGKVMNDDTAFKTELDLMERVYLGSRGKVNPAEFFHASQTGKLAYTLMDKDELYGPFAAYMQSKSGATAGTAAMTFASSMIGGHMDNKGKGFLSEIGLWEEGVSAKRLKMMRSVTKGMSREDMKHMGLLAPLTGGLKSQYLDLAVHHQSQFVQDILAPAIRKRFGLNMSDEDVAIKLMGNLNRNTSGFAGDYIVNALKFQKDAAIFNKSKGIGDAYQHYLKTPEGAEEAAGAAWKNFLAVFGSVYLPQITNGLLKLASGLDKLGQWVERNHGLVKVLTYAFAGLSAALLFGGAVNLIAAGFRGLGLALSFIGIGGAPGIARLAGAIGMSSGAGLVGSLTLMNVAVLGLAGAAAAFLAIKGIEYLRDNVGKPTADANPVPAGYIPRIPSNKYLGSIFDKNPNLRTYANQTGESSLFDSIKSVTKGGHYEGDKWIANGSNKPMQIATQINIDGKKVASAVTKVQSREANRAQSSGANFDGNMALHPVGAN